MVCSELFCDGWFSSCLSSPHKLWHMHTTCMCLDVNLLCSHSRVASSASNSNIVCRLPCTLWLLRWADRQVGGPRPQHSFLTQVGSYREDGVSPAHAGSAAGTLQGAAYTWWCPTSDLTHVGENMFNMKLKFTPHTSTDMPMPRTYTHLSLFCSTAARVPLIHSYGSYTKMVCLVDMLGC